MPRAQPPQSRRPTPSSMQEPSRRATAKDVIRNTVVDLEKTISLLPIPGLNAATTSILEIIRIAVKSRENADGLFELYSDLCYLENAVITPMLDQSQLEGDPAFQIRVDCLTSQLDQLARDWQKLKVPSNLLLLLFNHEDYGMAISDLSRRIKLSVDAFLLDSQASRNITTEGPRHVIEHTGGHSLSPAVQALPYADASFDSISRNNAPVCFKDTRVLVLDHILAWIMSDGRRIYVLNGIAGVGKTTIAQTIATLVASKNCLSASFFFSRYEDGRNSSRVFFPTLAYQLAQFSEDFEVRVSRALAQSHNAPRKTVAEQLKKLIIEPLQGICISEGRPILIILDALDECAEAERAETLQLLIDAMPQLPQNFKLLITMRPKPQFLPILDPSRSHEQLILHDIDKMIVSEDIRRYLQHQLSQREVQKVIHGCRWQIAPQDLDALVQVAGRLFIVASTTEKFIKDPKKRNPAHQLEILLGNNHVDGGTPRSPFAALDRLYLQIPEGAIPPDDQQDHHTVQRFQTVVGAVITVQDPLPPQVLAELVGEAVIDVEAVLDLLQSIIVSSGESRCPRVYHPSFPDFITSPNRCTNKTFLVETGKQHGQLAERCLDIMDQLLKRNICRLPIPDRYMKNHEIPDLTTRVTKHIPAELEYACTYWAVHLNNAAFSDELMKKFEAFMFKHLLFWLELLSLVGRFEHVYPALLLAEQFSTSNHAPTELLTIISDAQRFVTGSYDIIKLSALHVYFSALPFTPVESSLFRMYEHEASESVEVLSGRDVWWNPLLAVLVGHSDWVTSIAFSPDGSRLASSSNDQTVRLWNGVTGVAVAELKGHSGRVPSVVFSPDGTLVASASHDNTVRLWNGVTGAAAAEMKGHSSFVTSVMFSPDGTHLASGSDDCTVRLWDGVTGAAVVELKGHSGSVMSIMFSPGGALLASASSDQTIRLWNGVTGVAIAKLKGHSDWVSSVVFSPDGTYLASASYDRTVRLWSGVTGAVVMQLRGHSSSVTSIAFSPNGAYLASASNDDSVWLWNSVTGVAVAKLKAHSSFVKSVAFSPDGTLLASGSGDRTVRLWDGVTGAPVAKLKGHPGWVYSVVFSPDGTRLASGSGDKTVRLWNRLAGAEAAELNGHSGWVYSIAFSSDGTRLASASEDNTVWLWNGVTGAVVAVMKGHKCPVISVTFSPDGTLLASGSNNYTVRLWNGVNGDFIKEATFALMNGLDYGLRTDHRLNILWSRTLKNPSTISDHVARKSSTGSPSGTIDSVLIEFDEDVESYVIYSQWREGGKSASKIPLCWLPSSVPKGESTLIGTRIALGLRDGRIIILSTARLQLA